MTSRGVGDGDGDAEGVGAIEGVGLVVGVGVGVGAARGVLPPLHAATSTREVRARGALTVSA
jgi:hypothetical protein